MDYLTNKKQYVAHKCHRSNVTIHSTGVLQVSNIGPLHFVIYINDRVSVSDSSDLYVP